MCSTTGMLFYNSVLSLPMLLAATVAKGEPSRMTSFPLLWDTNFQMVLFLASAVRGGHAQEWGGAVPQR